MENKRYYYKAKYMNGFLDLTHQIIDEEKDNYEEITKEDFERFILQRESE